MGKRFGAASDVSVKFSGSRLGTVAQTFTTDGLVMMAYDVVDDIPEI